MNKYKLKFIAKKYGFNNLIRKLLRICILFNMICYCIGQKIDLNRRNNEQGHKIRRERRAKSDPEIEKGKQGHKIR